MTNLSDYDLSIDLQDGVVPISKAASALAALIRRARGARCPIVVTQKGYPTGVILDIELFTALVEAAKRVEAGEEAAQNEQLVEA